MFHMDSCSKNTEQYSIRHYPCSILSMFISSSISCLLHFWYMACFCCVATKCWDSRIWFNSGSKITITHPKPCHRRFQFLQELNFWIHKCKRIFELEGNWLLHTIWNFLRSRCFCKDPQPPNFPKWSLSRIFAVWDSKAVFLRVQIPMVSIWNVFQSTHLLKQTMQLVWRAK